MRRSSFAGFLAWLDDDEMFDGYDLAVGEQEGEPVTRLVVKLRDPERGGPSALRVTFFEDGSGRDCVIEMVDGAVGVAVGVA